jgi:SAM-dependent methyltransferase
VARTATTEPALAPNAALRWHIVRGLVEQLQPGSVLELGTGQGAVAARLAARSRYTGVEPDATSRGIARTRIPPSARLLDDLSQLDDGEMFDLVCAFEVLEHLPDDRAALASWAERVRRGGHLVLSVPADPTQFGPADELAGHLRRYDADVLRSVIEAVGLDVVSVRHYGFPLSVATQAGRNLAARRRLRRASTASDAATRTAGSARLFQPPAWANRGLWWVTGPFRVIQGRFPHRGPALLAVAHRPA